jgi:hypothetical protein
LTLFTTVFPVNYCTAAILERVLKLPGLLGATSSEYVAPMGLEIIFVPITTKIPRLRR